VPVDKQQQRPPKPKQLNQLDNASNLLTNFLSGGNLGPCPSLRARKCVYNIISNPSRYLSSKFTQDAHPHLGGVQEEAEVHSHLSCKFVFSQEVKECAISCMSLVVSTFGDGLERELPACLPILVDRM
ncbi:hypothetical protein ACJX0J_027728, partial [Zea mays]